MIRGGSGAETTKERHGLDNCYDQKASLRRFMTVLRHTYVI
jgi:hypothetical protein